jgi:hypothetical protein
LSIITADRIKKLEDNPSYCNTALADTNELFEQMITYTSNTLCSLFNSYHVLILNGQIRSKINTICAENQGESLLCIILTPYEIVNITHSEAISEVNASDIILIQNLIFASESLRLTESWVPTCLPGISDAGYLQLYCNFFEPDLAIVYITQYQEHSYFLEFAEQSRNIYDRFVNEKIIEGISSALGHRDKSIRGKDITMTDDKLLEQLINSMNMKKRKTISKKEIQQMDTFEDTKYLICKQKKDNQICSFRFNNFDNLTDEEFEVLEAYSKLHDIYKQSNIGINKKDFFYFSKNENFLHTIIANENFILFSSFNFFKEFEEVSELLNEILKTIKTNENYFFIK